MQLLPEKEQAEKLSETMARFNEACTWLAEKAFEDQTANKITLQQKYYYQLREKFDLSAQMAAIAIRHVGGTYSRDKSVKPVFRKYAAMPYDNRILSFKGIDRVSILTLQGRIIVPFIMGKYQKERFALAKGQCDLVRRKDGKWFLLVTADVPEGSPIPSTNFLGVDLGVVNIAVDSDGETHTNAKTEEVRRRNNKVRRSLQRRAAQRKQQGKRPKNIRRKLKSLSGRERRFKSNTNHVIAKRVVEKAKGTGRGIAVEELTGIRGRIRFRHEQRDKMSKWSFGELRGYIEYKARLHGVEVVAVDPRNTSRTCPECKHVAKSNRATRGTFLCRECGHFDHADLVGAKNIASVAAVMQREVPVVGSDVIRGTSLHYSRALAA